jgi:hypothetical protein
MKVYFGEALPDMIAELRGQAVKNVRLHTLSERKGDEIVLLTHVTTFCNNQIYEVVLKTTKSVQGVPEDQMEEFALKACDEASEKLMEEKLQGFEIRRGVLQE